MEETKIENLSTEEMKMKYVGLSQELFDKRKELIELVQVMTAKQCEFAQATSDVQTRMDTLNKETQRIYADLADLELLAAGIVKPKTETKE